MSNEWYMADEWYMRDKWYVRNAFKYMREPGSSRKITTM